MALYYRAGFYVGGQNTMTATVAGSAATIAAGYYVPGDFDLGFGALVDTDDGVWTGTEYGKFTSAIKTAFDAATGSTFTVTWSSTTGRYTISRGTVFTLTFATDADLRLRAALGFSGNKSGASSYTSDFVPAYIMATAVSARTDVVGPYEPDDIAEEAVSDGGEAFVVAKKTTEQIMTWVQGFEPRTSVLRSASSQGVDSWQWWFRQTRGAHPFLIQFEGLAGEGDGWVYQLTAKGASFKPRRYAADDDTYWVVPFEARWIGRLV